MDATLITDHIPQLPHIHRSSAGARRYHHRRLTVRVKREPWRVRGWISHVRAVTSLSLAMMIVAWASPSDLPCEAHVEEDERGVGRQRVCQCTHPCRAEAVGGQPQPL